MEIGAISANRFLADPAESLFGSTSPDSIIAATQSGSANSEQRTAANMTNALKREINRIRGYKLELTPAEKQKLSELQADIQAIEAKAANGTARADELEDRTEMLKEADRIIGKPTVDIEADAQLAEFNNIRLQILATRLDPATARRVEFMERYKATLEQEINLNPERLSIQQRFQAVSRQIEQLTPLRSTNQLSRAETRAYNDIVAVINDYVGVKVELTAEESRRVEALGRSLLNFQAALGPDPSQQPTSEDVARAYTSLSI